MPNMKRMAGGGNISELSDAELNRLGYAQAGNSMRGLAKTQLEGQRRRRAMDNEPTKRNALEDEIYKELQDSLDRGENASVFMNEIVRSGGGMKRHKAAEYKKGGAVKKMASGGRVRGDGCAIRGKTKGKVV
jgi:hypothetical protein